MSVEFKDYRALESFWMNNGLHLEAGKRFELKDAISTPNAPRWLPKVITKVVKEAQEPLLIGTSLLQRINLQYGQQIQFGAIGAMTAEDIPEGAEYPERGPLPEGPGTIISMVGKSGLAIKITEEMIRYSQYDVINMHLRAAGRALARHKEEKVWRMIENMGFVAHDNTTPGSSWFGTTTGRSLDGSANGSLTMDDIFDAFGKLMENGFTPNTMIMHPLTWIMFVKDPVLRAFALQAGGGVFFANWTGDPRSTNFPWANQGGLGIAQQTSVSQGTSQAGDDAASPSNALNFDQTLTSAPQLPSYFGIPLTIIVSPFVPYNPLLKTTSVYLCDRNELGVLAVDEDITTEEWTDPTRDIRKIKLRERYAIGILNEGFSICTMRNIHVVPNEIVLPAKATIDIAGSVAEITRSAAIS